MDVIHASRATHQRSHSADRRPGMGAEGAYAESYGYTGRFQDLQYVSNDVEPCDCLTILMKIAFQHEAKA